VQANTIIKVERLKNKMWQYALKQRKKRPKLTPWTCLSKIKKTIVYISREVQAQNQDQNASNAHSSTKTTQQQKASQKSLNQLDPSTRKQIQGIMNPFQQIKKLQQIQVAKRQEIIRQEIEEIVNNKQHSEDVNYRQTQQPYQQSVKKLVHVFRKSKPPNIIPKLGTHTAEEEKTNLPRSTTNNYTKSNILQNATQEHKVNTLTRQTSKDRF